MLLPPAFTKDYHFVTLHAPTPTPTHATTHVHTRAHTCTHATTHTRTHTNLFSLKSVVSLQTVMDTRRFPRAPNPDIMIVERERERCLVVVVVVTQWVWCVCTYDMCVCVCVCAEGAAVVGGGLREDGQRCVCRIRCSKATVLIKYLVSNIYVNVLYIKLKCRSHTPRRGDRINPHRCVHTTGASMYIQTTRSSRTSTHITLHVCMRIY